MFEPRQLAKLKVASKEYLLAGGEVGVEVCVILTQDAFAAVGSVVNTCVKTLHNWRVARSRAIRISLRCRLTQRAQGAGGGVGAEAVSVASCATHHTLLSYGS